MNGLVRSFFLLLAAKTDRELASYIAFLKEENRILRARLGRKQVRLSESERARLVKLGRPIGSAIRGLVSIVSPATLSRWPTR